ncbi:MAG TPA: adenylate/guanylate cyclase domain-containing protein [Gammaproteobacteria bacterium]|nr:adenylate/guanylate cyclase domain-containing protein [Gammaproteobacteria bacterium]
MNKRLPIFLGFFLSSLAAWALITSNLFIHSALTRLDNLGYDLQLKTYIMRKSPKPSPAVAIVDIDDRSLEVEGHWPWPRSKLAELVTQLQKQGAAVVAFDVFFSEHEPNLADEVIKKLNQQQPVDTSVIDYLKSQSSIFDNDKIFADSLINENSVLAIGFLSRTQTQNQLPPPLLKLNNNLIKQLNLYKAKGYIASVPDIQTAAKFGGFINIFSDVDGIFRHAPLLIEYNGDVYGSLALQAVVSYIGSPIELITPKYDKSVELEGIKVGKTIVPIDINGEALIPFVGKSYTFPYYPATDVLHGKIPNESIQGKIIFVGTSATGMGDLKPTAIQNPYPGVEIQASMASGILENEFSFRPAWTFGANLVLTILFGIISSIAFPYMGPKSLGAVVVIVPVSLLMINNWIWEQTGLVLSFIVPVLLVSVSAVLNILYGYLFESRIREQLKEMFGQYVPAEHINNMLQSKSGEFGLRGDDRDMSVLFADIRSFTTISEGLTAKQLVELLNTYLTPMTEIIFKNKGTIDKYVGDLIMAFWGAPLKDDDHAYHAIESAVSMQEKLNELSVTLKDQNWPDIKLGIGINSGSMSVGDMGSQYRRNYTVLGDNVNLASRIESLTKFYGAHIMIGESTFQGQDKFIFRRLDKVRVKGKSRGINIYEVLGRISQLTPELEQELKNYHEGLEAYQAKNWDKAYSIMDSLHQQHPDVKIYKIYMDRINEYKLHPVSEDWDGVYIHVTK